MGYICLCLKKDSQLGKQYFTYLENNNKCIEILKKEIDIMIGVKNLIGIDQETLKLYVHEKDKDLVEGVSIEKEIFNNGEEKIPLYPVLENSKIYKNYIKILKKHEELVKKSKKPKIYLENCFEEKTYRYLNNNVYALVMNKDFINQDINFEKYSIKKYKNEELENAKNKK